jgi:hypothetical protein
MSGIPASADWKLAPSDMGEFGDSSILDPETPLVVLPAGIAKCAIWGPGLRCDGGSTEGLTSRSASAE